MDEMVVFGARCELARRHFYDYCKLFAPDFYRDDRPYIRRFCEEFQSFLEGKDKIMIINAPPRHGKSRTAVNLVAWALGRNPKMKIMTASYNETLSTVFSKDVRDAIMTRKTDRLTPVYSDVFPGVAIKKGDAAMNLWSVQGGRNSYLATSPGGSATGFGADLFIIDDLIKNELEARTERTKEAHWNWFRKTIIQRLEKGKLIIVMTRWASDDLAGRALEHFSKGTWTLRHVNMKAVQDDGTMLCPEILSREDYEEVARAVGPEIAAANYQQEPIDLKGQLYTHIKTYDRIPADAQGRPLFTAIKSYTDTADTGTDYLCHLNYGVYRGCAYVLSVLYTQEPMEKTEPATARLIARDGVRQADIESNAGGRGFARAVKGHLLKMGNRCTVTAFTQTKNKEARILSNATQVMECVLFPKDWAARWPEYARAMLRYQRAGRNEHDDAPDATTGIVERMETGSGLHVIQGRM